MVKSPFSSFLFSFFYLCPLLQNRSSCFLKIIGHFVIGLENCFKLCFLCGRKFAFKMSFFIWFENLFHAVFLCGWKFFSSKHFLCG